VIAMSEETCPAPVYANSVVVSVSGYDAFIRFLQTIRAYDADAHDLPGEQRSVACVNVSHGMAWALAQLLLKNLSKLVVEQNSMFVVPKDVIERLELQREYDDFRALLAPEDK